jgi:cyclohexa-1,5-dienecarbonyl-CoA hydratase
MITTEPLVQRTSQDGVVRIELARPPLNILNLAMLDELYAAIRAAAADREARLILITGEGRAFCAGVEVADHTADRVHGMLAAFHRVIGALLSAEVPVVAAVQGAALGGGFELVLAADVVLAREDAVLGLPEVRLGVFPPAAAALLPRLIGRQRAMDLILSGRSLDAAEAEAMGLVARVEAVATFAAAVDSYTRQLASYSGPVLRLARRAVAAGLDAPARQALDQAEAIYLDELMLLRDPHEGLAAFTEKRPPRWSHA